MKRGIEIERKYIIKMPALSDVRSMSDHTESEIVQTYLASEEQGTSERVRLRAYPDKTYLYHTVKRRIDEMSCVEEEREITPCEYEALLLRRAEHSTPIEKTRHTFSYEGLTVEIDKYKRWDSIAVLEVELPSREHRPALPDFIEILFDVTGNFAFSNARLAEHFPTESEVLSDHL